MASFLDRHDDHRHCPHSRRIWCSTTPGCKRPSRRQGVSWVGRRSISTPPGSSRISSRECRHAGATSPSSPPTLPTATSTASRRNGRTFYEGKVQHVSGPYDPGQTIADVPYDGPIHPQTITALPTTIPFYGVGLFGATNVNNGDANYWITNAIPGYLTAQVQISVDIPQSGNVSGTTRTRTPIQEFRRSRECPRRQFSSWMAAEQAPIVLAMPPAGNVALTIITFNSSSQVVVQGKSGYRATLRTWRVLYLWAPLKCPDRVPGSDYRRIRYQRPPETASLHQWRRCGRQCSGCQHDVPLRA